MLNLSDCTINFGKSSHYARLALVIYTCALLLVFYSAFSLLLKIMIMSLLLLQSGRVIYNPIPHPDYLTLIYKTNEWILYDKRNQSVSYNKMRIIIDTGFFFLLELKNERSHKILVIFSDQLTTSVYRLLNIIEKIT